MGETQRRRMGALALMLNWTREMHGIETVVESYRQHR